jgi:hypothetical protein
MIYMPMFHLYNVLALLQCGILFNTGAWWIGVHYSPYNKRYCINVLPCITIWISLPDGNVPARSKM